MRPSGYICTGFMSHSGLKIEREISHSFDIRNFPQRNIAPRKYPPPPLYEIGYLWFRHQVHDGWATQPLLGTREGGAVTCGAQTEPCWTVGHHRQ